MPAPVFSADDFLSAFQKLMPRGPVWQTDPNSVQAMLERGLVTTWSRLNQSDADLLRDAFPATAVELLPEWESALGLPDPCAGAAPTIEQRQRQVVARLTDRGGLSAARYIALAADLGYTVTITTFSMSRAGEMRAGDLLAGPEANFTWRVNAPFETINYARAGSMRAGDLLGTFGNTVLECELTARAPAYTKVNFAYGSDLHDGFSVNFVTGLNWLRPIAGLPTVYSSFTSFFSFTRASSGTYRGADGLLHSAANDVPRIEYDVAGAVKGLALEASRQNVMTYSEDLAGADWTVLATSVSSNVAVAPDGNLTADKVIEDAGSNPHGVVNNRTLAVNTVHATSVWAKAAERSWIVIRFTGTGWLNADQAAFFNVANGTIGSLGLGVTAEIEDWGNGLYRCTAIYTTAAAAGTGTGTRIALASADGVQVYVGDGASGAIFFGVQQEPGARSTSYIKTVAAPVTRAQDRCTRNVGSEFSPLQGTFSIDCTIDQANDGTNQFLLRFSDATFNNNIALSDGNGGRISVVTASGGVFDGGTPSPVALVDATPMKASGAWAANDLACSFSGAAVQTDASATIPTGLTRLDVGTDHAGFNNVQRIHIRSFDYYPQRLSNAQLQALAT